MNEKKRLYAGAVRVCITPPPEYFPITHFMNHMTPGKPSVFSGKIAEDIYFRVLIVQNEETRLVFAVMDLPGVPESTEVTQLIADCAGVPEEQVVYTATHNHSGLYADNVDFERIFGEEFTEKINRYRKFLRELIPGAIRQAEERLEPVRMGVARSDCFLNVNRNEKELGPKAGTYGFRNGGPADRDLYLVRFDRMNGEPLAVLYNYAVHACMMIHNNPEGLGTEISGDLPGRACRILEQGWGDQAVVLFTSGCAGDMNPVMMSRVNIVRPDGSIETKELGAAGPVILEFMGNRFARDVWNTWESVDEWTEYATLWAGKKSFQVSAKAVTKPFNEDPVAFRVGLFMIGSLAIAATNGEIFHAIGQRIKEESPYRNTMIITHAGQWTAYVKDDSGEGEYEMAARRAIRELEKEFAGVI
ncbi:neutral/alkaline non-lysosomal ceramidase N-terminal domain-containing protein [Hominifimenecus sp. rT4P-3]|uniref:neutral/alkaline non-lysosomal ceramidase N-terminal domain-containing protein n=1 Tax=Hominifimenecus sp. rT4P-3 TaxID=3242979 RepID=UPI003DA2BB17